MTAFGYQRHKRRSPAVRVDRAGRLAVSTWNKISDCDRLFRAGARVVLRHGSIVGKQNSRPLLPGEKTQIEVPMRSSVRSMHGGHPTPTRKLPKIIEEMVSFAAPNARIADYHDEEAPMETQKGGILLMIRPQKTKTGERFAAFPSRI